ncbi:polyamine ABC transporter substrate-binding protein [Pseudomonas protegens]|uniref:Polyamine ABC transporter substrate-binding protein n=1 Tax=Pseudomonas protegens TaxID=380021 RepID=A0A2T6GBJ0_9PSED|nr:polyamine ABC transporter substrate-binding protein [Pseudomonas protegens]PUA41515.1 polyamine ABC transporter substrate-binding protein [Pseudomonas protegens]
MKYSCALTIFSFCLLGAGDGASVLAADQSVNLYNWTNFIAPQVPIGFTEETGIRVQSDTFDSADFMQSKVMAGRSGYDVVVATSNVLPNLISAGVLQEIDRSQLSNWSHMNPDILKQLQANDPGNRYAVPYLWGTTGIGYDVDKIKAALGEHAPVNSWDLVFKEENISKLKQCGVAMLDAPSEIISIALHYLGLPYNSQNPKDYEKAQALLLRIRPYIRYFDSSRLVQDLANGNTCLIVSWAGDASAAYDASEKAKNGRKIAYSIPKEGALVWSENFVLLKDAPHPVEGAAFINYLMRPDVISKVSLYTGYPTGNKDAEFVSSQKHIDNPGLNPSADVVKTLFPLEPLPLKYERIRTRLWVRVKNSI